MKYVECIKLDDGSEEVLKCVCQRCSTDDAAEHSQCGRDEARKLKQKNLRGWFGVELLAYIRA